MVLQVRLEQFDEDAEDGDQDAADDGLASDETGGHWPSEQAERAVLPLGELLPRGARDTAQSDCDRQRRRQDQSEADGRGDRHPPEAHAFVAILVEHDDAGLVALAHREQHLHDDAQKRGRDRRGEGAMRQSRQTLLHHHRERSDLQRRWRRELSRLEADVVGVFQGREDHWKQKARDRDHQELSDDERAELAAQPPSDPERRDGRLRRGLRVSRDVRGVQVLLDAIRPNQAEQELCGVRHERHRSCTGDAQNAQAGDDEHRLNRYGDQHFVPRHREPGVLQPDERDDAHGDAGPDPPARDRLVRETRLGRLCKVRVAPALDPVADERDAHARERGGDHHGRSGPHRPLNDFLEVRGRSEVLRRIRAVGREKVVHRGLSNQLTALFPMLRSGSTESDELSDRLAVRGNQPHTDEPRKTHGERDEHARTEARELETESKAQGGLADEFHGDVQAGADEGHSGRNGRRHRQDSASLGGSFGCRWIGEGLGDALHGLAGRPGERRIVENHPTRQSADEDAEVSAHEQPQGDLPPFGVEPDGMMEDVLDVAERREDDHHERHARDHVDHGLDEVELDGHSSV